MVTLGPKGQEATGVSKELYIGELHNLFSSPDIIRMTKLRRM
jgi:hypothetical protein